MNAIIAKHRYIHTVEKYMHAKQRERRLKKNIRAPIVSENSTENTISRDMLSVSMVKVVKKKISDRNRPISNLSQKQLSENEKSRVIHYVNKIYDNRFCYELIQNNFIK